GRCDEDRWESACAEFLGDPDPSVRGEAALALGRLLGERFAGRKTLGGDALGVAIARLAEAAVGETDPEARWREVYALASIRDGRTREALLRAAGDPSTLVRLFAIRGLGKGEPDPKVASALARAAGDPVDSVATEAAMALARHPCAEGATALVALLERESGAARRVAVRSLGAMGTWRAETLTALERALLEASPTVRAEVAPALARLGGEDALEAVDRALEDRHPLVREKAIGAELPEADALPRIESALRDASPSVVAAGAAALGRIPGLRARELAYAALRNPGGLAKENAAGVLEKWAAGEVPPAGDVFALLDAIDDTPGEDFAEVRATLLEALEKVETARRPRGGSLSRREAEEQAELMVRVRTVLGSALRDPDPTARAKAARAWESLVGEPLPAGVFAPRPRASPIPGLTAPPFLRQPRV
ncbi:MAG: HEAT repeat domain-containing protein, partial [Planctomycetota bacterium]